MRDFLSSFLLKRQGHVTVTLQHYKTHLTFNSSTLQGLVPVFVLPQFTVSDVRLEVPPEGFQGVKSKLKTIAHDENYMMLHS